MPPHSPLLIPDRQADAIAVDMGARHERLSAILPLDGMRSLRLLHGGPHMGCSLHRPYGNDDAAMRPLALLIM